MATKYKMTWRREQNGRWRKKYNGKAYYFAAPEGKAASYQRCLAEWLKKKAEIDQRDFDFDPSRRAWQGMIERVSKMLAEISAEDSPQNRRQWEYWSSQCDTYRYLLREGVPYQFADAAEEADPESVPLLLGGGQMLDLPAPPPPWEKRQQVDDSKTLQGNVARFLKRKQDQAGRGNLSSSRWESLRGSLEAFADHVGGETPLASINGRELSGYREYLDRRIDDGDMSQYTARDRLAAVKQFVRWAWGEELMGLPRILESRDFSIALPERRIETFTNDEVRRLLEVSSDSTKLYLLLMLNCGMQQKDIADLRQDEVDWKAGRVTRKRSKTRKHKGNNVPSVSYPLWPETFRLLKQLRSKHKELALTNENGAPLRTETIVNGELKKIDNIKSAYSRVVLKLSKPSKKNPEPIKIAKPLKLLRKTAATKLGEHAEHSRFCQYFLGHAPTSVADKHYVAPSVEQFEKAISWLGEQFGI